MSRNFSAEGGHYTPKCTPKRCRGMTPICMVKFIVTRMGQKQCINCLKYRNLLDRFPPL